MPDCFKMPENASQLYKITYIPARKSNDTRREEIPIARINAGPTQQPARGAMIFDLSDSFMVTLIL